MQAEPQDRPFPTPPRPGSPGSPETPEVPGMRLSLVLWVLIALSVGIELVLIAADYGLIGTPRWRGLAYQNGAFWAGLLYNWRPNYAVQPELMFVTYAFLHTGFGHLAGNMVTLYFLGTIVQDRVGQRGLMALYAISAIGGAVAFAALSSSPQPMVGASGALFGLAGAWQYWDWIDRRRTGWRSWPVLRIVLGLVLLNGLLWLWKDGLLAWETHLGGFIAGWLGAVALRRMGIGEDEHPAVSAGD